MNMAIGGIVTGDYCDCGAKHSMMFSPSLKRYYCTHCSVVINKTASMGKTKYGPSILSNAVGILKDINNINY